MVYVSTYVRTYNACKTRTYMPPIISWQNENIFTESYWMSVNNLLKHLFSSNANKKRHDKFYALADKA
jgi:hypothetical protein